MMRFQPFDEIGGAIAAWRRFGVAFALAIGVLFGFFSTASRAENPEKTRIVAYADHDFPPYSYVEFGRNRGFLTEIMEAVADVMNFDLEIRMEPWNRIRDKLERGEIDLILGMYHTKERDEKVDFTKPLLQVSHSIFTRKGSDIVSPDDLRDREILVQNGDVMHDFAIKLGTAQSIVTVQNPIDALRILSSGRSDAALLAKLQGLHLVRKFKLTNLQTVGPPLEPLDYCFAVPEGRNDLRKRLNEGIDILRATGRYDEIRRGWFGPDEVDSEGRRAAEALFIVILPLLALLAIFIVWNVTLKKRVARKTLELERELAEHRRTHQALKETTRHLERLVNDQQFILRNMGDFVYRHDRQGVFHYVSEAVERITGYPPENWNIHFSSFMTDNPDNDFVFKATEKALTTGEASPPYFVELIHADGSPITLEINEQPYFEDGKVGGIIGVARDVTERVRKDRENKEHEAKLRNQQKLESIGTLAAGVAHEINNPINIIQNYGELIRSKDKWDDRITEYSGEIIGECQRIASIVRNLLAFSRQDSESRRREDLAEIVEATLSLTHSILNKSHIRLQTEIADDLPPVPCNRQSIQQVLMNLLTNARDALNERYPEYDENKIVRLKAGVATRDGSDWLRVTVEDRGAGIPEAVRSRVFDPFFSTKGRHLGTGLGLSVSHGIVKEHGGELHFETEEMRFTRFHMDLPLVS